MAKLRGETSVREQRGDAAGKHFYTVKRSVATDVSTQVLHISLKVTTQKTFLLRLLNM